MSDPKKHVDEYLQKEGYPFEMKVAREFKNANFAVDQSPLYTDPTTGKVRETDVAAYFNVIHKTVLYLFKVIIECKHVENPWILFTDENETYNMIDINKFYLANYPGRIFLETFAATNFTSHYNWFKINKNYGYGLVDSSPKGKLSYEAISQIIDNLSYELQAPEVNPLGRTVRFFIPLVVIEGKLFQAHLNPNNEVATSEIDEGQLIYKSDNMLGAFPVVEICTIEKLPNLVSKLKSDFEKMLNENENIIQKFQEDFPIEGNHGKYSIVTIN